MQFENPFIFITSSKPVHVAKFHTLRPPGQLWVFASHVTFDILVVKSLFFVFYADRLERVVIDSSQTQTLLSRSLTRFLYLFLILMMVSGLMKFYWYEEFLGRDWLFTLEGVLVFFSLRSGFIVFFILDGVKLIWYELSSILLSPAKLLEWFGLIFSLGSSFNMRWMTTTKDCWASLLTSMYGS